MNWGFRLSQQHDVLRARRSAVDDIVDGSAKVLVPTRLPAINILDVVVPDDIPANEYSVGAAVHVRARRERGVRESDEQRRLGLVSTWSLASIAFETFDWSDDPLVEDALDSDGGRIFRRSAMGLLNASVDRHADGTSDARATGQTDARV